MDRLLCSRQRTQQPSTGDPQRTHPSRFLGVLDIRGLDDSQAGIKIARRNINDLKYADDTILMAESKKELKSLLIKVKEERGKSWLKTQHSQNKDGSIWPHHLMANRLGKSGNSDRFYFPGQNHCVW